MRVFKENEMFWEFGAGLRISEMLDIFKAMPDEEPLNTQVKAFRDVLSRFSHLLSGGYPAEKYWEGKY